MPITNFDKVELLLPMTGANNGTTFTDYSMRQRAVTRTGAVTSTAQSKFTAYGSSGEFIGAEFLTISHVTEFMFPPGTDFTIGGYFYFNTVSANRQLLSKWTGTASANNWLFQWVQSTKVLTFHFRATNASTYIGTVQQSWSPSAGVWYYIEVSRAGTTYYLSVDGTMLGSVTEANGINQATTSPVEVGRTAAASVNNDMYAQDVFIVTGEALHTANFTPPDRMTQRTLTRANTGTDSHEYDRAVLFDWNGSQNAVGHTGGGFVAPDSDGDFVATDLIDLEYGVAFIKDGCGPICRGPVEVDPDA
jgi:hypothetical protein